MGPLALALVWFCLSQIRLRVKCNFTRSVGLCRVSLNVSGPPRLREDADNGSGGGDALAGRRGMQAETPAQEDPRQARMREEYADQVPVPVEADVGRDPRQQTGGDERTEEFVDVRIGHPGEESPEEGSDGEVETQPGPPARGASPSPGAGRSPPGADA